MSKEMERLKSVIHFYKCLIKELNYLNFITKTNNYDYKIEEYQKRLTKTYKRIQELKEEETNDRANNIILQQK